MAVKISHASGDERGSAKGGMAGDQTGKEVKISNWYKSGWSYVARPRDKAIADQMVKEAIAGANNPNIGYDQGERNDLLTEAKKVYFDLAKITVPCETDCSAFVSVCVLAAGVKLKYGSNLPTTSNLRSKLEETGDFYILTDKKYLDTADHLIPGDILCKEPGHVVLVVDSNAKVVTAPVATTSATTTKTTAKCSVSLPVLKKGSKGDSVKALQILLIGHGFSCGSYGADGDFGSSTDKAVRSFQKAKGLGVDGEVGAKTWTKLLGVSA